jgi:hypothetical protein
LAGVRAGDSHRAAGYTDAVDAVAAATLELLATGGPNLGALTGVHADVVVYAHCGAAAVELEVAHGARLPAGNADPVVAVGGAAVEEAHTGDAMPPAFNAEPVNAVAAATLRVFGARHSQIQAVWAVGTREDQRVAREPGAAIRVSGAECGIGALRLYLARTGEKRAKATNAAADDPEHTTAGDAGADQSGEVIEALPVHPLPCSLVPAVALVSSF